MWQALKSLGSVLRELLYALIGQPSRMGPSPAEAEGIRAQEQQVQENLRRPDSASEAAGRVAREVGKAVILQPTPRAWRRSRKE